MKKKKEKKIMKKMKTAVGFAYNVATRVVGAGKASTPCFITKLPVQTAMILLWTQCRG